MRWRTLMQLRPPLASIRHSSASGFSLLARESNVYLRVSLAVCAKGLRRFVMLQRHTGMSTYPVRSLPEPSTAWLSPARLRVSARSPRALRQAALRTARSDAINLRLHA